VSAGIIVCGWAGAGHIAPHDVVERRVSLGQEHNDRVTVFIGRIVVIGDMKGEVRLPPNVGRGQIADGFVGRPIAGFHPDFIGQGQGGDPDPEQYRQQGEERPGQKKPLLKS